MKTRRQTLKVFRSRARLIGNDSNQCQQQTFCKKTGFKVNNPEFLAPQAQRQQGERC